MTTPTPVGFENASSGLVSSFNSSGPLLGVTALILFIVLAVLSSQTLYRYVVDATSRFAKSVEYAAKGVVTAVVLALIAGPLYLLSTVERSTQTLALKVVGGIVVAYVGLVVLGMLGEYVWTLLNQRHERATGETLTDRFSASDTE